MNKTSAVKKHAIDKTRKIDCTHFVFRILAISIVLFSITKDAGIKKDVRRIVDERLF